MRDFSKFSGSGGDCPSKENPPVYTYLYVYIYLYTIHLYPYNELVCICKVSVSDEGRWGGCLHEGGWNCIKYLKRGWNRKGEGRGNKNLRKGSKLGQGTGA